MALRFSSLAFLFQLLFLMCGSPIYSVKDLREKQQDTFHGKNSLFGTGDTDILEGKDSPQLLSQLIKELQDGVKRNPSSQLPSQQLVKELDDTYSSITGYRGGKTLSSKNHGGV
ncbi:hypothetical protein CRYUN_Cryun18bG0087400 [Craigia yunnanensis]